MGKGYLLVGVIDIGIGGQQALQVASQVVALVGYEPQFAVKVDGSGLHELAAGCLQQRIDQFGLRHGLVAGDGQRVSRKELPIRGIGRGAGGSQHGAGVLDTLGGGGLGAIQDLFVGRIADCLAVDGDKQQPRLGQHKAGKPPKTRGGGCDGHAAQQPSRLAAAPRRRRQGFGQRAQQCGEQINQAMQQQAGQPKREPARPQRCIFNRKTDGIQKFSGFMPVGQRAQPGGQPVMPDTVAAGTLPPAHGMPAAPVIQQALPGKRIFCFHGAL